MKRSRYLLILTSLAAAVGVAALAFKIAHDSKRPRCAATIGLVYPEKMERGLSARDRGADAPLKEKTTVRRPAHCRADVPIQTKQKRERHR